MGAKFITYRCHATQRKRYQQLLLISKRCLSKRISEEIEYLVFLKRYQAILSIRFNRAWVYHHIAHYLNLEIRLPVTVYPGIRKYSPDPDSEN